MSIHEKIKLAAAAAREQAPHAHIPTSLACPHRGYEVAREECPTCRGKVEIKVFQCNIHKTCTLGKPMEGHALCLTCKDKPTNIYAAPTPSIRNLLYYLYPVAGNGVWQTCIDQIASRIDLFNGKIILCVACDPKSGRKRPYGAIDGPREGGTTDSASDVEKRLLSQANGLSGHLEVLEVENSPDLWESAHHNLLFSKVASHDPAEATLYAHGKGVTRPGWHPAHAWRDAFVETLIDAWPLVADSLIRHPVTGSFKKTGRGWPAHESRSLWHYSGSWFWFRNRDLFAKNWRKIDRFWAAIESYPSLHFRHKEAGCVFHSSSASRMNLYDPEYWKHIVMPELERFRKIVKMKITPPL